MYSLTVQKFETGLPGLKSAGHQVVLLSEGCHKEPFSYIFQLVLPPFPHLQKSLISLPKPLFMVWLSPTTAKKSSPL